MECGGRYRDGVVRDKTKSRCNGKKHEKSTKKQRSSSKAQALANKKQNESKKMMQVEQPGAAAGEQQQYADGMMGDEDMEVSRKKQTLSVSEIVGFSHDLMVGCVYRGQSKIYSYFQSILYCFHRLYLSFSPSKCYRNMELLPTTLKSFKVQGITQLNRYVRNLICSFSFYSI